MTLRPLAFAVLLGVTGISTSRAQAVYEATLGIRESNVATFYAGKFWLHVGAQGQAEFQAAVTGSINPGATLSARLESPETAIAIDVPLGEGGERTYAGCDPLGRNPYLPLPESDSLITCPAFMTATFFQGGVGIPAALVTQLLAQRGTVRLTVKFPDGGSSEITGALQVTGVAAGRQYYLTPVDTTKVAARDGIFRLTWESQVQTRYLVQFKSRLGGADWENPGFAVVATASSTTVEIPINEGRPQNFFRVLRLR